ncbi:unnamed protein product, partial [Ectocarpus sp. 12 AP-2014]
HLSAGDPLSKPFRENSLVITRAAEVKGAGDSVRIPARLLLGIVPEVLLRSFHFWQYQDDSLVGVPSKLNRYKRAGTKAVDLNDSNNSDTEGDTDGGDDGDSSSKKTAATAIDNSLEDGEGEGDVGGGAGLTLIKIRLFKE